MNALITTLATATQLLLGLAVRPIGPWDPDDGRAALSSAPGVAAALLVTLLLEHLAGYLLLRSHYGPATAQLAVLPYCIGVAGLVLAALAAGRSDALATSTGVLALSAVVTLASHAGLVALVRLGAPGLAVMAAPLLSIAWLGFGLWRLTGIVRRSRLPRRALATLAALAIVVTGMAWPGVRPAEARPPAEPEVDARIAAMRAVVESFDTVDVPQALIEQPARIAARVAQLPTHPAGPETLVLAIGGEGYQAIFDREARRAAAVLAPRGKGPVLVISNTAEQVRSGIVSTPGTVALVIEAVGKRARPGDTIILYLTSHGGEDASLSMDAPGITTPPLTASQLAAALDRAGLKQRVVIISACYAGSWIDALANPTTIVMAAAAADRTSFGCDDTREFTLFGESLLGELARPELPLATAFARAQTRIAASERAERITPSLPEARVGNAMQAIWTARQ